MLPIRRTLSRLRARRVAADDGATAIEYALMVSLIAVVIVTAVALIGTNLNIVFGKLTDLI